MITVPGDITSSSGYFCFIDKESFPVGTLIPKAIEKSETASTALYKRASSPGFLHGHIQLADNDTLFKPSSKGAQMMLVKDSVIAFLLPAAGSISAAIGRSEEHTSELQSRPHLVCRLLLEKKKNTRYR